MKSFIIFIEFPYIHRELIFKLHIIEIWREDLDISECISGALVIFGQIDNSASAFLVHSL